MKEAVKRPMFFKFFIAEHSSERMFCGLDDLPPRGQGLWWQKIPLAFQDYIKGRRPQAVLLTGPSGDSWMVGLIEEEGALYFGGGWPKFVEDHSVQTGDFLVFRYDGEDGFEVQVFDPTMSPREASFFAWNSHRVTTESIGSNGVGLVKQESDTGGAEGSSGADHFSFQITMKAYHVNQAILCHKDYVNVMLCDEGGKRWPVWMIRRKDITKWESWFLSKGFPAFIRDNRVKEGDTCTFELVGPSLLRVRISRA
ncbi:B3 domain-containing protein Os03g0212300-like [Eucalyptus grandis]|uniref:B3 domain-containing protein Os03g0212300-like n=1 Tax=Eucalyptus grandis TaxID=71139 RepID=UPI00192EAFD0|nr:B3 domain-containing protein Os03g0212300-like [Eucalyptus grandis]